MTFEQEMLLYSNNLYGYARKLTRNIDQARDLVQDTYVRALANKHQYKPDTNMKGWLMRIMRNDFLSKMRKAVRIVEDPEEKLSWRLKVLPRQLDNLELKEVWIELERLPKAQRDTILMVAIDGLSMQEAAAAQNCAEGTIKSRLSRARTALLATTNIDFNADNFSWSAMSNDDHSDDPS